MLLTVVFGIALILAGSFIYLGTYSHADPSVSRYLQNGSVQNGSGQNGHGQNGSGQKGSVQNDSKVTVTETENGYRFDGPGKDSAVIFYPGAKIEATAYAPLLYHLAEQGKDCFLVEMPFRFAMLDSDAAGRLTEEYDYRDWYLMGHSLGGAIASNYVAEHPQGIRGLILLAAYPMKSLNEQKSDNAAGDTGLLSIYGSRDGCLDRKVYAEKKALWPSGAKESVIDGGNHAQFGSYGKQRGDQHATISADEQQQITIDTILKWISRL